MSAILSLGGTAGEWMSHTPRPICRLKSAFSKDRMISPLLREVSIEITELEDPPLHLLLGNDVLAAFREKLAGLSASIDEWEATTRDVGFADDKPRP